MYLSKQGQLLRYDSLHYSKDGGDIKQCCVFVYGGSLIITTPELYDLPPEQHSKELTFLHYLPVSLIHLILLHMLLVRSNVFDRILP